MYSSQWGGFTLDGFIFVCSNPFIRLKLLFFALSARDIIEAWLRPLLEKKLWFRPIIWLERADHYCMVLRDDPSPIAKLQRKIQNSTEKRQSGFKV